MKLVLATRNPHKLEEMQAIFNMPDLTVCSAFDFPHVPETVEDGDTLEANAIKKAEEVCAATGLPALADDSGLEVEALNGEPGVYSARWSGEGCTYADNNEKLLRELADKNNRRAQFRTVIALAIPGQRTQTVEGSVQGRIIEDLRGDQGFGYDPLFMPDSYNQTFAELPADVKNKISHRARALNAAQHVWAETLKEIAEGN